MTMATVTTRTERSQQHKHEEHDDEDDDIFRDVPLPAQITMYVVVSIAIIVTNSLTIAAVATRRKLRTIPNMYVTSLAVADLLVGVVLAVSMLSKVPGYREVLGRSEWWCLVTSSLVFALVALSTLSMLIIAIDR